MASAQVLRKQEQLAAGRKKLEEFRRKKIAEKAKKATSSSPVNSSDGIPYQKQSSESELAHTDDNGVRTSDALALNGLKHLGVAQKNETNSSDTILNSDISSSNNEITHPVLVNKNNVNSSTLEHSYVNDESYKGDVASSSSLVPGWSNKLLNEQENDGPLSLMSSGIENDSLSAYYASSIQDINIDSYRSSYHGSNGYINNSDVLKRDSSPSTSSFFTMSTLPGSSAGTSLEDNLVAMDGQGNILTSSCHHESINPALRTDDQSFIVGQRLSSFPDIEENEISDYVADRGIVNHSSPWTSERRHSSVTSDTRALPNYAPALPPADGRRSRSSFLDSIHISKDSSSLNPYDGVSKADISSSTVSQKSVTSSLASGLGAEVPNHVMESKHDFFPQKPNEDFTALEQHIEDLTQEKFSLQRGLEASRALAESLASENSALTDSFNKQGSTIHQLKFDLENLQEEIKVQLMELEAVKLEYGNALLECNAADERAKLLASEIIGLEEKALCSRSNELKLERQVEDCESTIVSCRKKISSLEKERQDLQSTIDAFQEEKKLFQSKLQKASSSGMLETKNISYKKRDESTSTEDLDIATKDLNPANFSTVSLPRVDHSSELLQENRQFNLEGLSLVIPSEQMRIIESINALIAELSLEKDQLTRALLAETFQTSTLLELNKELTRKLEAQTQRLELLTAQSTASDSMLTRQSDSRAARETIAYADEGDEVVERVLGWIMQLFPGGPTRRRTNKRFSL